MGNNRFLFLEKELMVFDAEKPKKRRTQLAKGKSRYSMQKLEPAVTAALIGVGWKVFEFGVGQTAGDIEVNLARLVGTKYPNDDEAQYKNKGIWKTGTVPIYQKVENYATDEISARILLRYKYNGHGVADIDMDLANSNDAVGWGLKVETKMMPSRNSYLSRNGGHKMAMVEVTINYRFSRTLGSDIIKIKRVELYGDGTTRVV